jgi:hypothetical protein
MEIVMNQSRPGPVPGDDEVISAANVEWLLEWLHRTPPKFEDERLAPPLDRDRLRLLARHKLDKAAARPLFELIQRFQSWRDTYRELLVEEFHRGGEESHGPQS